MTDILNINKPVLQAMSDRELAAFCTSSKCDDELNGYSFAMHELAIRLAKSTNTTELLERVNTRLEEVTGKLEKQIDLLEQGKE